MKDLASLLAQVKTVAIAGHVRPDGDCVGSCLATYNYIATWFPQIQADVYAIPVRKILRMICALYRIVGRRDVWERPSNILRRRKRRSASTIM